MAVLVGTPADFGAALQDNGNTIPIPDTSSFAWTTDGPNDTVVVDSTDSSIATITVPAGDGSRTSITVTASVVAPDGKPYEGSTTTEVLPGVEHTFTVVVGQMTPTVVGRKKKK